jgi:CRISPR/Cas system-associated endonuclease Cas3-HD
MNEYKAHIEKLCATNGIALEWAGRSGRAWRKIRRVRTPEIRSAVTYAIALHEIGHILGEGQSGRRLDKEVGAWLWAKANALEWRKPMKRTLKNRLNSYLRWCQRRRGAWIPPQGHAAWRLAA